VLFGREPGISGKEEKVRETLGHYAKVPTLHEVLGQAKPDVSGL